MIKFVRTISNPRVFKALGFSSPLQLGAGGDASDAPGTIVGRETNGDGVLMVSGGPAAYMWALAADQPEPTVGAAPWATVPSASPVPDFLAPAPAAALSLTPSAADSPATWLERLGAWQDLRGWVLTEGLAGPASASWASFAMAMGWEVPLAPPTTEAADAPAP